MKKVLVIGGTQFIGRCLVEKLIQDERLSITLFNRGQTNPGLFPEVQKIIGDRETNEIDKICVRDWDYIIDISCYYPNTLRELIPKLKGRVGRYIFVSTVSSYDIEDFTTRSVDEENPLLDCTAEEAVNASMRTYGQRKAECDRVLLETDWLDKLIIRPSIVYGKYDSTWRFYYWLYRINRNARMILPDGGLDKGNYTYVEDLANILIESMTIEKHSITYNVSTHPVLRFSELLARMASSMDKKPEYYGVDSKRLHLAGIRPVKDIPLWLDGGCLQFDNSKLLCDFSLELCDFDVSLKETIEYYERLEWPDPQVGMSMEDELGKLEELI